MNRSELIQGSKDAKPGVRGPLSRLRVVSLCVSLSAMFLSCSSKPTDLGALAPADSLVYVETNDLGELLRPIVDSKSFLEAATSKPDISAVQGVQLAIAVTGFETSEEELGENSSILNFRPRFVAIADTHLWEWQTNSFAENQLGEFVNKVYGGGVDLKTTPGDDGTEYVWTSEDGRKAYGFVIGSLVLFGNDRSSIDKVQAVRRGEAESISRRGKLQPVTGSVLSRGYVSEDGMAQIANFIGAAKAKESGEEAEVQSFVARILPQILRGAIKDASWLARRSDEGIEDRLSLRLNAEVATVLNETLSPADTVDASLLEFAPADAASVTQYNLRDPQVAWRSILLVSERVTDPASGRLLALVSNSFFEPYGIRDGEKFLSSVSSVVTLRFDDDEDVAVISRVRDSRARTESLDPESLKTEGSNVEMSGTGVDTIAVNGDPTVVRKCLQARETGNGLASDMRLQGGPNAPVAVTVGRDRETALLIAGVLSERKKVEVAPASRYRVESSFDRNGMERRMYSEFGLVGSIISMLADSE